MAYSGLVKQVCDYKEKCYRKKPSHFEEYAHPHLEELLDRIGNHSIHVPFGYNPSVSHVTLKEQLEIVRNLKKNGDFLDSPKSKKAKLDDEVIFCDFPTEPGPSSSRSSQPSPKKINNIEHSRNLKLADSFKKLNDSKIFSKIDSKWAASCPYNIFYTSTTTSKSSDRLSITFSELLDPCLGTLESSLLINFMVEFGWVLACYYIMESRGKPMTIIYGEIDEELGTRFDHFLSYSKVKPPSPFGTHHTKMMIFSYDDSSIRVVVCTANLVESDWTNKTQGVWISPRCPPMDSGSLNGGDSITGFKKELIRYLSSYNLSTLSPWIEKVKNADMSDIRVFFVGSVPGSHTPDNAWGQLALRKLLQSHIPAHDNNSFEVIAQCSSIGSLGPEPGSWLLGDILTTFSSNKSSNRNRPDLSLIYPTFANVEASADGLIAGGCLPYSFITHKKQEWLVNYLRQWKSDRINRTGAIPHIKCYTRVSSDFSKIPYFLLTSANMSKAAWGTISKKPTISILSYEAGVLLVPQIMVNQDYFPLNGGNISEDPAPSFTLPYDLPLTPYSHRDIPWFIDNLPG